MNLSASEREARGLNRRFHLTPPIGKKKVEAIFRLFYGMAVDGRRWRFG
jgi:hypothetical protein